MSELQSTYCFCATDRPINQPVVTSTPSNFVLRDITTLADNKKAKIPIKH